MVQKYPYTLPGFNTADTLYNTAEEAMNAACAQGAGFRVTHTYEPNLHGLIAVVGSVDNPEVFSIHVCGGGYVYDAIP